MVSQKKRGTEGRNANNMPADPLDRVSNLVHLYPGLCESFKELVKNIDLPPCWVKFPIHLNYTVSSLLYGSFDCRNFAVPPAIRAFACEHFGLSEFEDCLTPKRKEFLLQPTAGRYNRRLGKDWAGDELRLANGIKRCIKALRKRGYKVEGSMTFSAEKRVTKSINQRGDITNLEPIVAPLPESL